MPKNVIVCCDGTWNFRKQKHPTNVARCFDAAAPTADDGTEQRRYYHAGVGTHWWDKWLGGAFGVGLSAAVRDCYRWVVENYEPGDQLYLFGFSRGAYTARSLAGLIRNAGILRHDAIGHVDDAYALYRAKDGPDAPPAEAFRTAHSLPGPVPIHFIGVWDTVGALGVPDVGLPFLRPLNRIWEFHDVQLSSRVRHACHALALDERRKPFVPTLWQPQPDATGQSVHQVWFAGAHCDVGGGYPETDLADLALHWLTDRARDAGLAFNKAFPVGPDAALGRLHESRTGIYTLVGPVTREPGTRDPNHESLASCAAQRIAALPAYGSSAARAYARGGPQTPV